MYACAAVSTASNAARQRLVVVDPANGRIEDNRIHKGVPSNATATVRMANSRRVSRPFVVGLTSPGGSSLAVALHSVDTPVRDGMKVRQTFII